MRKLLFLLTSAAALAVASPATAADETVTITSTGFEPATVNITEGDTVTWRNNDTLVHQVTVTRRPVCTRTIQPGQSASCTFPDAGTFEYRDPTQTGSGFNGTIEVSAAPAAISLEQSRTVVIFGGSITLTGTVATRRANVRVTLFITPRGEQRQRVILRTGAGGVFRYQTQPRIFTEYHAQAPSGVSNRVRVLVRPRITLRKVGRNRFSVVVVAGRSFAGRVVNIARCIGRSASPCRTIKRVVLRQNARIETTAQTTFILRVRPRTKLRAIIAPTQVMPGYVSGQSNFIAA
jgi:plastocyanin